MFYEVVGDEPVSPLKRAAVQEILKRNKAKENFIFTSVATHLEVIPKKLTEKDAGDEREYLSLFDGIRFLDYEISRNILMLAREIKNFYYRPAEISGYLAKVMDSVDAIHLATAVIYGATEFHTRDDQRKGVKIPLVTLYKWSGNPRICGKFDLKIVSPEADQGVMDLSEPKK